ncbi:MAG: hypothetical protein NWR72_08515 [Bacteroidia bacterium]|nr:hypothetical protein [Bacteroidia bacterium]
MMMNLITTLLVLFIVSPVSVDSDKDKKKGKDQYYKYEREDVSVFREKVDFTLPDPPPAEFASQKPTFGANPIDLNPKFTGGQRVVVEASPMLQQLVARDRELKRQIESMPGYRIHVYAGTGRQQAWDMKRRALGSFPNVASYLDYLSPNYVVRLGDFLDRDDAITFLRDVRRYFPGAFLVTDNVKVPKPEAYEIRD